MHRQGGQRARASIAWGPLPHRKTTKEGLKGGFGFDLHLGYGNTLRSIESGHDAPWFGPFRMGLSAKNTEDANPFSAASLSLKCDNLHVAAQSRSSYAISSFSM
jgi:hypothetical protein